MKSIFHNSIIKWQTGNPEKYGVASIEEFVTVEMPTFQKSLGHIGARASLKTYRRLRAFLRTLEAQQRIGFRDIVTGDES
jgi:hypothetical protein